jgi:putative ABC transport system substrate-binding protein
VPAAAQTSPEKVFRLGELAANGVSIAITRAETLPELARLGFREGRNLVVDERVGDAAALARQVREMLAQKPDVLVAIGAEAIDAAGAATKTVPIVTFGGNPVQSGLAESLAHPGGNVTGVSILTEELESKRAALLHEAIPWSTKVAVLFPSGLSRRQAFEAEIRAVVENGRCELVTFDAAGPDGYPAAFAGMRAAGAQSLLITGNPTFNRDAELLAKLALESRLPVICEWAENARSGCLMGYGANRTELRRRVAHLVARIFRGVRPADLPIETPTYFELAVNLKTARALGIEMPASLLAKADEVID